MTLEEVKEIAAQQRGQVAQALRWCIQEIERHEPPRSSSDGVFWTPAGVSLDSRNLTETAIRNVDSFFTRFKNCD